ncbi:MAG: signal peptidase II [Endomicrobium sp.]|jgi:signal peptidase II|nr:signal peptidase II [Endomicrobium sp.]
MKKPVVLAAALLIFDQISKYFIDVFVIYGSSIKVISHFDFFNITNVRNTGVAFSFFQDRNLMLAVLSAAVLVLFCVWLYKNGKTLSKVQLYAFCIIIAGGTGNVIDRIFRGAVVDFLDFGINSLRWPSFNVADSSICIGAFLIILDLIKPVFKNKKV